MVDTKEEYIPEYKTSGASGFDLKAAIEKPINIKPGDWALIPTGVKFEIPKGFEIQIRPRSGLANKGIFILNSPGTIDSDYRGEVKVILANFSKKIFTVKPKDRIAQGVLCKIMYAEFVKEENLPPTERGEGGFGSTGCS